METIQTHANVCIETIYTYTNVYKNNIQIQTYTKLVYTFVYTNIYRRCVHIPVYTSTLAVHMHTFKCSEYIHT